MTIDMTPPPAVIEFAQKAGYEWGVDYIRKWDGFEVYFPYTEPIGGDACIGEPQYILLKNSKIRWANEEEQEHLMNIDNNEN